MALREYDYRGSTYQFDDEDVPAGAVLRTGTKAAAQPRNTAARKPRDKQAPAPKTK
ncbi:hypothetical protein [Rathayibacter sp. AY1B7]|uniref:hypothetical protein n=1 Tax=Rathayibacter sp. AY1B7 TaxID=2080532 RepID=UPI0015E3A18E|nr:hypothetical protein [Rathayibacter sp. AY1B7]